DAAALQPTSCLPGVSHGESFHTMPALLAGGSVSRENASGRQSAAVGMSIGSRLTAIATEGPTPATGRLSSREHGIAELAVMANVLNPETESITLNTELETLTLEPATEQVQPSYESTSKDRKS